MKIAVAQTKPVTGDIQKNIGRHKILIDLAVSRGVDTIIFPELSLTGYEPPMAAAWAISPDDSRLDELSMASEEGGITIGAGVPTRHAEGTRIGMILFQPGKPRRLYAKRYLHADEEPFFVSGPADTGLIGEGNRLALAICYEISVPQHAEDAFASGAKFYVASVVKSPRNIDKALTRLSQISRDFSVPVLMANSIGQADGETCAGMTSVWNDKGQLIQQLDDTHEGILILDTDTQEATAHLSL
ncbi:MAG: carbon-nitrogen hydrolase family protein [Chitinophagaceae bacterium]|nr:carbon-nitrogen hydrolase family protein [Chitinophagaceae bacterium]